MSRPEGIGWALALWAALFPLVAESQSPVCLPILCYHAISSRPATEYEVSGEDFRAQLRYLKEKRYETISLTQWIRYLDHGAPLPPQPVVLTFDDGYVSAYQTAFPLLESHGFTATFFVSTRLVSTHLRQYLTWAQMREIAGAGMEIMPHGHSHANLARRKLGEKEASYRARVKEELELSRSLIHSSLGSFPRFFAYPFGAYDQEVEAIAKDAGFSLIFTACPGVNTVRTHRLRLKRQLIYRDDGLPGFISKLEALPLEVRFPFGDGDILSASPQRIEMEIPPAPTASVPPLVFLGRRPVSVSCDSGARRISLTPAAPLRAGLHLLEVRLVEDGSGRWHQDSVLFAIRPPESEAGSRN